MRKTGLIEQTTLLYAKDAIFIGTNMFFSLQLKKQTTLSHCPFLFKWNFTHLLTAIHLKPGKPDFIKVGGTPYKS